MPVSVITPPEPVVALDDVKRHLRVDFAEDDAYITGLIAAATAWLDGPDGWLGRALGLQTLELVSDGFGQCRRDWIDLEYPPIIDIVSVKYTDTSGNLVMMAEDDYRLVLGNLRPAYGNSWPAVRCESGSVRIRYRAGYATSNEEDPPVWTSTLPAPIKVAIMMLVAQWYETREAVAIGATVESLPFAVDALLSPYRVYR